MTARRLALLGLLGLLLTTAGTAQTMYDADVNVNISDRDLEVGDTLTMAVSLEGFDEDAFSYQFLFGGEIVNSSETVVEHRVTGQGDLAVRVLNGSTVIAEGHPSRSYSIGMPDDLVQIDAPDQVAPGETFNATASLKYDVGTDIRYTWYSSELVSDAFTTEHNQTGSSITLKARENPQQFDDPTLEVEVRDGEDFLGNRQIDLSWDLYNPDVDGMDATYEEGYVDLAISQERLDEGPEVRLGASLKGFSQIDLGGRLEGGGISLTLEQVDTAELDPPEDVVVYSGADISGQNIHGVRIHPHAVVSEDWLEEHGLLITDHQAAISYYRVDDGDWERLPSETAYSDLDNHLELNVAFGDAVDDDAYMFDGPTTIVIAGNTEGIDFGRFAVGPEGQCDRLEEDEPLPLGWEEIEVTCDVHESAQDVRERLDEWEQEEGFEIPDGFEENISEVESMLDEYRVSEAEQTLDRLREQMAQAREERRELEHLEQEFERLESQEQIPPELRDQYNRSAEIQEMIDTFQRHLDEGNVTAAEQALEQIEEQQEREFEQLQRANSIREQIEELRQRDLSEQQQDRLEEAEQFLEEGNFTAAERQIGPIRENFQRSGLRQMIESVVRDVLSDILGLGLGGDSGQQMEQTPRGEDRPQLDSRRSAQNESNPMDGAGEGSQPPGPP